MSSPAAALIRNIVIGLVAFLTLVDLFATQAILPSLVRHYGVSRAAMGTAVNASTIGMAISGLAVALLARRVDRRRGIIWSLALLAVPTTALAWAPDLATFTALRVAQGLCMSAAFALTLAHLAESCSGPAAAGAFAAYITGNVASNLFGRLLSAVVADHFGLSVNFLVFAALNLSGALLVYMSLRRATPLAREPGPATSPVEAALTHLRHPALRAGFAIGFLILFAFIGTFTYVNFVLVEPPLGLGMMALGVVYLVFAPSILTTPLAGHAVARFGTRPTIWAALGLALAGLPLLLLPSLPAVLAGMVLVAVGTFFAQATATGFVSRTATSDRAAASGLYLASYFAGGMVGSALLGLLFDRHGWPAAVAAIAAALTLAALLATRLRAPTAPVAPARVMAALAFRDASGRRVRFRRNRTVAAERASPRGTG
jgi:predicted MFS family arabinose efflux permease